LPEETRQFCREQFNIEFAEHGMDEFVEELFDRCEREGILRQTGDTASTPSQMVEQALKRGELDDAFRVMEAFFRTHAEDFLPELIGLRARYARNRTKIAQGVISQEHADLETNKLTQSLIDLNRELQDLERTAV
jgi:hypothetical protein